MMADDLGDMTMVYPKCIGVDNGNCRVYYRLRLGQVYRVYCFQEDRPGEFVYYACSSDGEPSFTATTPSKIRGLPPDDCATGRNFRTWLGTQSKLKVVQ
jgi:hypothetical protein